MAEAFKTKQQGHVDQKSSDLVDKAIAASHLPKQPPECGVRVKSGVEASDALDVALEKTDSALFKANNRIQRCYKFNQHVRQP